MWLNADPLAATNQSAQSVQLSNEAKPRVSAEAICENTDAVTLEGLKRPRLSDGLGLP
jgi:hypothetical protein